MKKLTDLTREELMKVLELHEDLKERITKAGEERAIGQDGDAWFWISEYLDGFPGEASISCYYDYVNFSSDIPAVCDYLRNLQKVYCYLGDDNDYSTIIDKMEKYYDVLQDADYSYSINVKAKDYAFMENYIEKNKEMFENKLLKAWQNEVEYFYDDTHCLDFALEFLDELSDGEGDFADIIVTDDYAAVFDIYELY